MSRGGKVWLESLLHIKRSIGLVRGKSDKIDAELIARFAMIHQHHAKLVKLTHPTLQRLQYLMRLRARLLKSKQSQDLAISETEYFDKKAAAEMKRLSKTALEGLSKSSVLLNIMCKSEPEHPKIVVFCHLSLMVSIFESSSILFLSNVCRFSITSSLLSIH